MMSLVVKEGFERIPPMESGTYIAICNMLADLGTQNEEFKGKSTQRKKIWISFLVPGETVEYMGEEMPRQIGKEYTACLSDNSRLLHDLNTWRGVALTPDELKGFNLQNILGVPCMISVTKKTSADGKYEYSVVSSVIGLPKGTAVPGPVEVSFFDLDDPGTYSVYDTLPRFLQVKISQCMEFPDTGLVLPDKDAGDNGDEEEDAAPSGVPAMAGASAASYSAADFKDCQNDDLPF